LVSSHALVQIADDVMQKPPGCGSEVNLSTVAVASLPYNVHVGQTRLLEPGVGKVAVFTEEY
jgi:hypothetical protein